MTIRVVGVRALHVATQTMEAAPDLQTALAQAFADQISAHVLFERADQLDRVDVDDPAPDLKEHYFYPFQQGIVGESVLAAVVAALRAAGWAYACATPTHVVLARTPYVLPIGRGHENMQPAKVA